MHQPTIHDLQVRVLPTPSFVLSPMDECHQAPRLHLVCGWQSCPLPLRCSLTGSLEADNPLSDVLESMPRRTLASVATERHVANGQGQD